MNESINLEGLIHLGVDELVVNIWLENDFLVCEKVYISVSHYKLTFIPVDPVSKSENSLVFFIWDNTNLGKVILYREKGRYYLCIQEALVVRNEVIRLHIRSANTERQPTECGRIHNYSFYKNMLKKEVFTEIDTQLNYEYALKHREGKEIKAILGWTSQDEELDTLEKSVKVMRSIHKLFITKGEAWCPKTKKSGLNILKGRKELHLNCRGYSILLNDILLALGIKSKIIICMSSNFMDPECHVTNQVFIEELNKWIMLDAATQTFVMGKSGVPLGVEEVRKEIIKGEQLDFRISKRIVNQSLRDNKYERYLIKNMYCFMTYIKQEPYCDEMGNKRVMLLPINDSSKWKDLLNNTQNIMVTTGEKSFFC